MQLNVTQVNSRVFSHSAARKLLVAEISDTFLRRFERLYDDACDEGFALRNPVTGNVTRWSVIDRLTCGTVDNEVQGWVLHPCSESVYRNPELEGYEMRLIND